MYFCVFACIESPVQRFLQHVFPPQP